MFHAIIELLPECSDENLSQCCCRRIVSRLGRHWTCRVGGHPIDGANNILAYCYFPQTGDSVMDTNDTANFAQSSLTTIANGARADPPTFSRARFRV